MTEASLASLSHDLARAFRPVLNAMANPGRIFPFGPALAPASGLTLEAAAVAIALCDFQTPIWLAQDLRSPATEHYLRFHTGAPLTHVASDAVFAFANAAAGVPNLSQFAVGTHEYPDRSATVVIEARQLRDDLGVRLAGPGIKTEHHLSVNALNHEFWQQMIAVRSDFPLGLDVIFVAPGAIAAIPRSTAIQLTEIV